MNLKNKTEKETKELIKNLRKEIKLSGYDSVSFIKMDSKENSLIFNVKAKNGCGYKNCDIDEDLIVKIAE